MNKLISFKFSKSEATRRGNIISFDVVASKANVMTSHGIVFKEGAFKKAIKKLKTSGKNNLLMLFQHMDTLPIGGFPVDSIKEKNGDLMMVADLNMDVEKAKEVYSLIQQGVLTDISVGVVFKNEDLEYDKDSDTLFANSVDCLMETSIVGVGSNPSAAIVSKFGAVSYQDLPIGSESLEWDKTEALKRVKEFTKSEKEPSSSYKRAFFWFDSEKKDNFGAYKLPFADVVDGKLVAVPSAISAVIGAVNGARGGVDIPSADISAIKRNVNRYREKMGKEKAFSVKYINEYTIRDCEKLLKQSIGLSETEAKTVLSILKNDDRDGIVTNDNDLNRDGLNEIHLKTNILKIKQMRIKNARSNNRCKTIR